MLPLFLERDEKELWLRERQKKRKGISLPFADKQNLVAQPVGISGITSENRFMLCISPSSLSPFLPM
jgi:hypothetical protein